jgi:hypothetical protein
MTTTAQPGLPEGYELKKKKKPIYKRVWFLILAGIVLIFVIAQAMNGGGSTTSTGDNAAADPAPDSAEAAPDEAAPVDDAPAGLNTVVSDGKFDFAVSGMDCSRTEIGESEYLMKEAQGVFCIVSVRVANIGDEAQYFDASSQKALDAQGREYSADSSAAMYLGDSNSFLEQLNPGSVVDGQLVYDVPAGTQLTQLELHDSMFSGGVTVNLG